MEVRPGRDVCLNFCGGVIQCGSLTRGNGFMTSQDLCAGQDLRAGQALFAGQARCTGTTLTKQLLNDGDGPGLVANLPLEQHRRIVIAFVGMGFEAKIAAGPGVLVVCRDSSSDLANVIESAVRQGYRGVISFGVAGGLAANLRTGDWVVASAVLDAHVPHATDVAWSSSLVATIPGATYAPILGVDAPVAEPAMKRKLHKTTGACAVDMESHVMGRLAAAHGLAFAAVRVIIDPAERAIPSAALLGMRPDGGANVWAVLRDLVARPSQLLLLVRIAVDAFAARAELLRVRRLLGPHFRLADIA
jgi:hopanoid-associated phosphorylase